MIATATGSAEVSFTLKLGYRRKALDATSGQVIIACQDAMRRKEMLTGVIAPKGFTASKLNRRLDDIASKGFLIAPSHDVVGVTDVCAPILNSQKRAMASIVVPCLNRHGSGAGHEDVAEALIDTCQAIGAGASLRSPPLRARLKNMAFAVSRRKEAHGDLLPITPSSLIGMT